MDWKVLCCKKVFPRRSATITVRYLGIEMDDALEMAEQTEV